MKTTERLELVPIEKLVGYARNSRTHSPQQISQLRSSLREFGFVNPVLCDKDFNIISGHGRVAAAKEEGITNIPCVFIEHLTEQQKKAYILADNRLALDAGWDNEFLSLELSELKGTDFDLSVLGFNDDELSKLFDTDKEIKEDNFDLTKALEEANFVEYGDVWILGRHRLMCGDATNSDDVKTLMDNKKANLVLTDPPYAVSVQSRAGLTIMNDAMKSDEFYDFLFKSFTNMAENLDDSGSAYVFHADTEGVNFRKAFVDAGFYLSEVCVWVKNKFSLGRSPYQWQHEPILFGWKVKGRHRWLAGRKESTVWNFNSVNSIDTQDKNKAFHPTVKPLDLLAYPIKNSCQVNGIVLDTFGGSGSTLIACEQTNRICFMMELDRKYASVILRRFHENFPKQEIVCKRGSKTYQYQDLVKEVKTDE
ncbi:MAG: site-specific DNA-methyltransferase [Oscillospiraceae bacterium]|jgi:DNA modification methylase|nr:site-specific DNA-methyltransferase [Oscillospiraceae bacterium]